MSTFLSSFILLLYLNDWQTTASPELAGEHTKSIANHMHDPLAKCTAMKCKVICFNGKSYDIEKDVKKALQKSHFDCPILEELYLYSYEFPNSVISRNFLSDLTNKIKSIYIASSDVTDIERGAFGNGIFSKIKFENLNLIELRRDFFEKVTRDFEALSIIQSDNPPRVIHRGFLNLVQSRIRSLTIQVGLSSVENITSLSSLLSNLAYLDLSHNDLRSSLTEKSFFMVSMVERLDLSYSKLTALPKFAFSNIARTLKYLDISHNNIRTISSKIFGWHRRLPELKILANDNDWFCDCELKYEINEVFGQHTSKVYCSSPEEYRNFSVSDDKICAESKPAEKEPTTIDAIIPNNKHPPNTGTVTSNVISAIISTATSTTSTTKTKTTTTDGQEGAPMFESISSADQGIGNTINLVCGKDKNTLLFKRPERNLFIMKRSNLRVDVSLEASNILIADLGLIWFSKVTKEYYDMEVNYNEYGLGCYSSISFSTTVENLMPNVAYTFCLVEKSKPTVSPFNCKSVHVSSNLSIRKAWVNRDLRCTGISLTVLGIVLCTFIGIYISFLILKHKPILLKGSKRIATPKGNGNEIVVLPKDCSLSELKIREQMLAKGSSRSNISSIRQRRSSTDSDAYMNNNLYEELPAYFTPDSNAYPSISNECNNDYIMPLAIEYHRSQSLSYTEIPFRRKRSSNDPLPELPKEETQKRLSKIGTADITKHNFKLSTGYAFAYDCVV